MHQRQLAFYEQAFRPVPQENSSIVEQAGKPVADNGARSELKSKLKSSTSRSQPTVGSSQHLKSNIYNPMTSLPTNRAQTLKEAYRACDVKPLNLMLFCLPDYAITRVANYAPDFWAWNSGTFVFKTPANTRDDAIFQTLDASKGITNCEVPEKQERIDLLTRLLMEYTPSNGREETEEDLKTRIRVLNDLAIAHRSRSDYSTAKYYLKQALDLAKDDENLAELKANYLHELAIVERNLGEIGKAITLEQQAMEIFERIGNVQGKAATLHQLAIIYADQGDVEKAIAFYQQSLELEEKIGNVQGKAATLHELAGIYANLGDVEKAIAFYQQSLEILQHLRSPDAETVKRIISRVQQMAGD